MVLLRPRAFARRVREFMGPAPAAPEPIQVPDKLATLGDRDTSVVALDYKTHPVRLLATSPMERKWRARSCKKEPWTVAWIEASMRGGGVLYDIGANVGTFSLVAAKVCGRRGTVVAFEPGFASYAHLCGNIVLNRCEAIIIPVPLAVAGANGLGRFRYLSLDPGQSRHDFKPDAWDPNEADTPKRYIQPILSMTLDAAVATFSLPAPNYLKIDVDGAELAVLQGAVDTLANPALRSILIEIDESQTDAAMALLDRGGFALARTHKGKHGQDAATRVWYGEFERKA